MIFKKLKDRYNIIILIFVMVLLIIQFRLATIMIVQGEEYREQAENRIIKTIPLPAARGEIRDRYGRLLAGNRPSFTVQMMKNEVIDEQINEVALTIINILEKNEDRYNDEFPIHFTEEGEYVFNYDLELQRWKEANDLLDVTNAQEAFEVLRRRYSIEETEPAEIQQQLLKMPNLTIPISIRTWKFTEEMRKEQWLQSYNIQDTDMSAHEAFQTVRNRTYRIPENYSDTEARKIMVVREQLRKQGYLQYQPVRIAQDISEVSVTEIEENIMSLPGVNIAVEPIRYYPEGEMAAHTLGYLGKISQQNEIDRFITELGYLPSDIIGKTGIEHSFEETLKGKDGSQRVEVDSFGRLRKVLERVDPIPGDTVYTTLDANIQRVAEETLVEVLGTLQTGGVYETQWGSNRLLPSKGGPLVNANVGAVVVTDVKNGEVLALANYPAYDPNLFATGISMTDWQSLMPENERDPIAPRPLLNVATNTAIQPGSIFKMIVGLAGIEQGLSPDYRILDRGFVQIGGHSFGNWLWNQSRRTMGYQGLHQAIADSNNYYFYSVGNGYDYGAGRNLPIRMNMDILTEYTKMFGLNDRTGIEIEIPRERSGGVPSIENKTRTVKAMLRNHLRRQMRVEDLDETMVDPTPEQLLEVIEEIVSWADENPARSVIYNRMLDLGVKEDKASIYTDVSKYSYFTQARWSTADTMNFSIGQGEHAYTPIQMTNYMAILANGGYRYNLSLIRKTQSYDEENIIEFPPELVERIPLKDYSNLDEVNYGMHLVQTTGTARGYFNRFPINIAGKTGTAQREGKIPPIDEVEYLTRHLGSFGVSLAAVDSKISQLKEENKDNPRYLDEGYVMREAIKSLNPRVNLDQFKRDYDNYAWFSGFAPYEDPQIAITVLIFNGGSGGYGAPIFREIVAEYMGLNTVNQEDGYTIENRLAR